MKISCIIPVYNEAARVGAVLNAVLGSKVLDEVIVINDGSSDNSLEVLEKIKRGLDGKVGSTFRLISYEKNRGKTHAVKVGIEASHSDFIMTIDSDLIDLDASAVDALAQPVLDGKADVTMSLRKNSFKIFHRLGIDFVSGERVFNKSLIGGLSELEKLPGFGLEVFLNNKMIDKKVRLKVVYWPNVICPRKSVKMGFWAGSWGDFKMNIQLIRIVGLFGYVRQLRELRRLFV